jgi:hypothetical protein
MAEDCYKTSKGVTMAFTFRFEAKHPEQAYAPTTPNGRPKVRRPLTCSTTPKPIPPLASGIEVAKRTVATIPEVKELPAANKDMILHMADLMIRQVNATVNSNFRGEAFWGLYLLPDEDPTFNEVELLSVGTIGQALSFTSGRPWTELVADPLGADVYRNFRGPVPADASATEDWYRRDSFKEYDVLAGRVSETALHATIHVVDVPVGSVDSLDAFMGGYEPSDFDITSRLPLVVLSAPQDVRQQEVSRRQTARYH